jgi:hypothetical protein
MEQRHRDFIACRPKHDRKAWLPVRAGATLAGARVETEFQDPRIAHSDALDRMSLHNSPVAEHDSVEGQRHKGEFPPSSLYLSHATVSMKFLGRGPSGRFSSSAAFFFLLEVFIAKLAIVPQASPIVRDDNRRHNRNNHFYSFFPFIYCPLGWAYSYCTLINHLLFAHTVIYSALSYVQ